MALAGMISLDESALICDFAETYHILDYRALPLRTAAVLACGLREDSRIKMKLAGMKIPPEMMLQASTVDRLSMLVWAKTKDAQKGRKAPKSILEQLTKEQDPEKEIKPFESAAEFDAAREKLLQEGG